MRQLDRVVVVGVIVLGIASAGGSFRPSLAASQTPRPSAQPTVGGTPEVTVTPTVTATEVTDPAAQDILKRSDSAMNRLASLRVDSEFQPTVAPERNRPSFQTYEYVAPNKEHFTVRSVEGTVTYESIKIGLDHWYRRGEVPWTHEFMTKPAAWPNYSRSQQGFIPMSGPTQNIRLVGEEEIGGEPAWTISYTFQVFSFEGLYDVFVTEWMSKETSLLLRRDYRDNDRFGVKPEVKDVYVANADVLVEPPISRPTASPTVQPKALIYLPYLTREAGDGLPVVCVLISCDRLAGGSPAGVTSKRPRS